MSFDQTIVDIENAARHAGSMMLEARDIYSATSEKGSFKNLVTEYDRQVQEYLFETLSKALPEARFLGEEEGAGAFHPEYEKGYVFVIDPIDGTSNFITGYRPSVTSIGLLKDGKPYIGVVYNPYEDVLFSAQAGCGAYRNHCLLLPPDAKLSESLVSFGTAPYYGKEAVDRSYRLARYYQDLCIDVRRSGSAAWDICCVASGSIGLYIEPVLQIWDYCAAALILMEVNGKITDFAGKPLSFRGPSEVLAVTAEVATEDYFPDEEKLAALF